MIYCPGEGNVDIDLLEAMTHAVEHRGPDDFGFGFISTSQQHYWRRERPDNLRWPGVAMGHRRLSILDPTPAGQQPFRSSDGNCVIVYNGEVYNYVELRQELVAAGHTFATKTDTEVLLAAYREWGTDCFEKFNGMWSLVLWDAATQTLVASRDRFGIKPLYYAQCGNDWLFASETRSLFLDSRVSRAPNEASVARYLTQFRSPVRGASFFRDVQTLAPGTWLRLQNGRPHSERFWSLPREPARTLTNLDEAVDELRALMNDSVRLRMRSDVRVGTMVSGGLDSTTVISTMNQILSSVSGTREIVGSSLFGFHASFPDLPIDETAKVNTLEREQNLTVHKVLPMAHDDIVELFNVAMTSMERPFLNSVPMVHTLLMRRAQSEGVKVILNGHGSDELFAGYPGVYPKLAAADALTRFRLLDSAQLIIGMSRLHGLTKRRAIAQTLEHILPYRLTFWNKPWRTTKSPALYQDSTRALARTADPDHGGSGLLDTRLRRDFLDNIVPSWMDMEDRISMSASVEARQPFLDHRLAEFAFSLANNLKVNRGMTKYVLRVAMGNQLPKPIVADTQKFFFSGPDGNWLRGPLWPLVSKNLLDGEPRIARYVNHDVLRGLIQDFRAGATQRTRQIWTLFNTEMWLRQNEP